LDPVPRDRFLTVTLQPQRMSSASGKVVDVTLSEDERWMREALDEADRELHGRRREASLYTTVEPCLLCIGAAMTAMVGRVVFALESPTDGATAALRWWDDRRDRESFPAYRAPDIVARVLADAARQLFADYVARSPNGGALVDWARTLTIE
jgi:tRNA(adenine34) deaminase